MTRRLVFDRPGMPQERPQEPHRRLPEAHRCQAPGCTAWAFYGLREPGVAQMRAPCVWFCREHIQNFGTGSS